MQLEREPDVTLILPQSYVENDLTLAYASTSHAAQGRTVDTGHAVVDISMTRGELYPNLTRGREWNGAYVITNAEADDERGNEPLRSNRMAVLAEVLDRDTAQHAAIQVMQEEIEAQRSLATMGTIWTKVIGEQARDRYADVLLGLLGPERMEQLDQEHGAGRLWRAVRNAELAGSDVEAVLRSAVEAGELGDAKSLSDVLRWRLNKAVGEVQNPPSTWDARTPTVKSELGHYTRALATAMDHRQRTLGANAAIEVPDWAAKHLGPVPTEPEKRAAWVQRAGVVAGWRELANVQGASALGPAPSREMPDLRAAWLAAYAALGASEAGRNYAAASDAELDALVRRHDRERQWAPVYVADLLSKAQQRATLYERSAVMLKAQAAAAATETERSGLEARAKNWETAAGREKERGEQLTTIHEARAMWHEHTAEHAHAADMARRELARRAGTEVDVVPVDEVDLRNPRTKKDQLDAAVASAHDATLRILEQREMERRADEWMKQEPAQTVPDRDKDRDRDR